MKTITNSTRWSFAVLVLALSFQGCKKADQELSKSELEGRLETSLTPLSAVTVISGTGEEGHLDGPALQAKLGQVSHLALGPNGEVYFIDVFADGTSNSFSGIRVLNDGVVSSFYEAENSGILEVDKTGNVFISAGHSIVKISKKGKKEFVLVGNKTESGYRDGPCKNARFGHIRGFAIAEDGSYFISDVFENVFRIRKIDKQGMVSTIASSLPQDSDKNFFQPTSIELASNGDLYVNDNQAIKKIASNGEISTLARFDFYPGQISLGPDNSIYFSRTERVVLHSLLTLSPDGILSTILGPEENMTFAALLVYPAKQLIVADDENFVIKKVVLSRE